MTYHWSQWMILARADGSVILIPLKAGLIISLPLTAFRNGAASIFNARALPRDNRGRPGRWRRARTSVPGRDVTAGQMGYN